MVDTTIQNKLLRLGYSQLWLDSGILTIDNLEKQIKELNLGEDENTEHYRYRTFINYFHQQASFENNTLNQVIHLLQTDCDKTMAGSATVDLLRKSSLTDEQFDTVAEFLETFGDWAAKQVDRSRRQKTKL